MLRYVLFSAQKLAMSVLNVMSTVLGGSFNAKVCTVYC